MNVSVLRWITRMMTAAAVGMVVSLGIPTVSVCAQQTSNGSGRSELETSVLQLRDEVEISSFIVRLGDVVEVVGTAPHGWDLLSQSSIGLLPVDGRRLRMDRQRISEVLNHSGRLKTAVRWVGKDFVSIRYVPPLKPLKPTIGVTTANTASVPDRSLGSPASQVAYRRPTDSAQPRTAMVSTAGFVEVPAVEPQTSAPMLPAERNRIERLVMLAFFQTHQELTEKYEVKIVPNDPGISKLEDLRSVRALRLMQSPQNGTVPVEVLAESSSRQLQASVSLSFSELPQVVFTAGPLTKGDILSAHDLIVKPMPARSFNATMATDTRSLIGMQVTRSVSADRPLQLSDVSPPTVIERGDLVEIRVIGEGITVTSNGRALAAAAAGESIMVETENPKRKITARAASHGVVEIITRAPKVHSASKAN